VDDSAADVYYAPIALTETERREHIRERLLVKLLGLRTLTLLKENPNRYWDIIGTAIVVTLAAILRFWMLGRPKTLIFDETYYVKDAFTLWQLGFEAQWPDNANIAFEAGDVFSFTNDAAFVVHPQVGKWLIALGMAVGGGATNPLAWRLANAIFGVIAVWLVIRIARRLFASTAMGLIAGLFMSVDGGAIVHSRTALLDQFLMVFALAAFGALLLDREQYRWRLANTYAGITDNSIPKFRWWLLAAGILLGLAAGVKWSGIYFLAIFGLLSVWWDFQARRIVAGKRLTGQFWRGLMRGAFTSFMTLVPTAIITYVATWFSWFITPGAWGRQWASNNPGLGPAWLQPLLRSFWHYHGQMWTFHTGLSAEHPYAANPLGWLIQWRPTVFYWRQGAEVAELPECAGLADCVMSVTSLGNPILWWLACASFLIIAIGLVKRDWRALAAISGVIAGWTPWLLYTDRTIFTFYSIAFTPWMIFTLGYACTVLLEFRAAPNSVALWGSGTLTARAIVIALVLTILAVSALFYPIWTAQPIEFTHWQSLMWLPSWI